MNELLLALNNKLTVGGIFCDLEKAFDFVKLSKCEFYGFRGTNNVLLRSYLIGRYQSVLIDNSCSNNNTISEQGRIKHGIPQGSVLDPLFFMLNISDFPNITADLSKPVISAFDTSIIIAIPSPSEFKEDIKNIIDNIFFPLDNN